jgi:predicted DCC family thiol-disulfide oxidoreductase YuxK
MKTLYVLHDPGCGFCEKCREWLSQQPAFVELRFIAVGSAEARRRFPGLADQEADGDLVVISDEGAVYRGSSAYIMCLYALVEYREWAQRLASPALFPLARRIFHQISKHRLRLSQWFFRASSRELDERLDPEPIKSCKLVGAEVRGEATRHPASPRL